MLSKIFAIVLLTMSFASRKDFNQSVEHLASKSDDILILKGAFDLLNSLKPDLSPPAYQKSLSAILDQAEQKLGFKISEEELSQIISLIVSSKTNSSNAGKIKGLFSLVGLLVVLASLMLISGIGYLLGIFFVPLFLALSPGAKTLIYYALSLLTLWFGYNLKTSSRTYIGFTGSLALGAAFLYHAFQHRSSGGKVWVVHSVLFAMWAALAVVFQSRMIGFLAVIALEVTLGYRMSVFVGLYVFGFDSLSGLCSAVGSSLVLLVFYVLMKFGVLKDSQFASQFHKVFDVGVLSVAGFVYHLGLLILTSMRFWNQNEKILASYAHFLMVFTAIFSFVLQAYDESFGAFRAISMTFFVFYLLTLWVKFSLTKNWAICAVGLGALLYGFSLYIEKYPMSFIF